MECSVLNSSGMLSGKVAKSSSRGKLWKSLVEVVWGFWSTFQTPAHVTIIKQTILDIYRRFTGIPKPVVSQRSQSKERQNKRSSHRATSHSGVEIPTSPCWREIVKQLVTHINTNQNSSESPKLRQTCVLQHFLFTRALGEVPVQKC